MEIATLISVLDEPHLAEDYLQRWKLRDFGRGRQILIDLADTGLTLDLLAALCKQLTEILPQIRNPDAALNAFRNFLFAARGPLALVALFERDPSALRMLLNALSLGPRWAEILISDPEVF